MLPLQEVVPVAISSSEHSVEVRFGRSPVLRDACQQIGSHASDAHPGDIVVVFVVAAPAFLIPRASVACNEVRIEVFEHSGILLVTSRFECVENYLEHLCIAPPAAVAYNPSGACFLVAARFPFCHHIVALVLRELFRHRFHHFYGPSDAG